MKSLYKVRKFPHRALRGKIDILDLTKIKNFYSSRITVRKMNAPDWKKRCAIDITEISLCRINKELL